MIRYTDINQINYISDPAGRALFMALAILTVKVYPDKTPYEVLQNLYVQADAAGWPKEAEDEVSFNSESY
jgi:hypothetical protein